jgi:hypothetical protein
MSHHQASNIRTDPYMVFGVRLGSQLFTLLGYCCKQYSNLVKMRLKWKIMEYGAKIYYKPELIIK